MNTRIQGFGLFLFACLLAHEGIAVPTNEVSRTSTAAGNVCSNGSFKTVFSLSQGMPVGWGRTGSGLAVSGFISGLAPTVTPSTADSDGDTLSDWDEVCGLPFSPLTPTSASLRDTDGDGAPDDAELITKTNPLDSESSLRILYASPLESQSVLYWLSSEGVTYDVIRASTVSGLTSNAVVVSTLNGPPGYGPWREGVCSTTNATSGSQSYFSVRTR